MARLEDGLDRLATMSPADLGALWQEVFKTPAPSLSPDLLRHGIAWALQDRAAGGAAARANRGLVAAAAGSASGPSLRLGSQLVRSWNGRTVEVTVTRDGYHYDGKDWISLSAIARAVTGTNWSGPRFFGLRP